MALTSTRVAVEFYRIQSVGGASLSSVIARPTTNRITSVAEHGFVDLPDKVEAVPQVSTGYGALLLDATNQAGISESFGWQIGLVGEYGTHTLAVPSAPGGGRTVTVGGTSYPAVWLTDLADFSAADGSLPLSSFFTKSEVDAKFAAIPDQITDALAADSTVAAAAAAAVATQVPQTGDGLSLAPLPGRLYNIKAQNAEPYSQDSVTTHNGVQYAVWVDENRNPIIGKRTMPHGTWTTFDLATISGNPLAAPTVDDLHNNYVVAVDSTGFVHVSGNHHDSALRYVRSTAAGSITAWTAATMVGTDETSVTYPQFLRRSAELLFVYRNGSSGNGDTFINVYNTTTKTWARRSQPFKGTTPVSPDESAYTNHLALGDDGMLHLFYMWRTTSDVATTHDLKYIRSADGGVTWANSAGAVVALPVTPASTDVTTLKTGNLQQINQSGADADSLGRPHACWWLIQSNATNLVHFWFDGAAWHEDIVDTFGANGTMPLDLARPAVFCHADRTFVIFSREFDGHRKVWRCKDITPAGGPAPLPEFSLLNADLGLYEPTYDTRALNERGELHLLVTPIQPVITGTDPNYTKQWGAVLTLDLAKIDVAASTARVPVAEAEQVWIPATELSLVLGTPVINTAINAPAWAFDSAATEVVSGARFVPPGWRTFDVDMWWTNAGAGAGDVVVNTRYVFRKVGNNMTGGEVNPGNQTLTAPAQNVITVSTVLTGLTVLPGQLLRFNHRRSGADVLDTLANDNAVFGFVLRKTS